MMGTNQIRVLAINPGSTSTKFAVYEDESPTMVETLRHAPSELVQFGDIMEQHGFRKELIARALVERGVAIRSLTAVVGRGGLLRPIPSGVWVVTPAMIADLRAPSRIKHASNLGALIAAEIAGEAGCPAYVVDPIVVDELEPIARLSGLPELERRSVFHALNHKAVARKAAAVLGKTYEEINLVVAHMGGGITVGAHRSGRVVDVTNGLDGEGPFTPERAGGLPAGEVVRLAFSGRYSESELLQRLVRRGGLLAYLGTNDAVEVERRLDSGDAEAFLVYRALAYQVAKDIGAMAAVLEGHVHAVVLTGGLTYSKRLVEWIRGRVGFLGEFMIFPGENELEALALGVLRVLKGEEAARLYEPETSSICFGRCELGG